MHNDIFEITKNNLSSDEWADDSWFYEDDNVDYTTLLNGNEREEIINDWFDSDSFNSLFSRGSSQDTILYNGGLKEIKEQWYERIRIEVDTLATNHLSSTYSLRKTIDQPIFGYTLFCLPEWSGTKSSTPRELLEWLETLEPGTLLYINSVFDYHS